MGGFRGSAGAGRVVVLVPTAIVVAAGVAAAWFARGSTAAADWLGYALLVGFLLAAVLASGFAARPARAACLALAALTALAACAAASIAWSPAPSLAREEALLVALYAAALAVPLTTLRCTGERAAAIAIVAAACGGLALATAVAHRLVDDPAVLYDGGRLTFPVSYVNAQAAVLALGFWPAVALAVRRAASLAACSLWLSAASAVLAGALLAQSKGSLAALAVAGVAVGAVSPDRWRVLGAAALAAAPSAVAFRALTAPFRADEPALDAAARGAGAAVFAVALAGGAGGLLFAVAHRRLVAPGRLRVARRWLVLAAMAVTVAVAAGVVAARPGPLVTAAWGALTSDPADEQGGSHLASLGSNRHDFWRVAAGEFRDHPWLGIGSRGFGPAYLQHGRSRETPARAHSLELDLLSEQGAVGFLLLVVGLGLPLLVAARRARTELATAGALGAAVYWLAHASADWIWTIPAAGLPFVCLLGIAVSGGGRPLRGRVAVPAAAAVAAAAALAFAPPWLASRLTDAALAGGHFDAPELRLAQRLDPLSAEALVAEAALAPGPRQRISALRRAAALEPRSAGIQYLLGVAYLDAGRRLPAGRALLVARRLDPRNALVREALRRASRRKEAVSE